jgi:RNA polymerase sigma-70 factor (ECF subfamily)
MVSTIHGAAPSSQQTPLEDLLERSSHGDVAAFAELYDALSARVFGLVVRVVRDVHESEEVTQEVLLQVWQSASLFDPARGSARAWVLTLAHRRAVDRVRSSEALRRRDEREALLTRMAPRDETAEAAHRSLEADRVRALLATLPRVQRDVIELAYLGGHTHSEVSRLMQIPLGTAKSRIRDGLIKLRDGLAIAVAEPA